MSKPSLAIGLMSGTSMDGIDAVLMETDGEDHIVRRAGLNSKYDEAFRTRLRQALQDASGVNSRNERPGCLGAVERELTELHGDAVTALLKLAGVAPHDVGLIAFHGQTVLHRPEQGLTMQIGDGPALAARTGIDVVYDLRAADVAAGGQGAPLAPMYHRAMAAQIGGGPIAVLNIGGVANVTFVTADGALTAFDTGPGNALLDDWVFSRTGDAFDVDGRYSGMGQPDQGVLAALMRDGYFAAPPPKSLDRNHFPADRLSALSVTDGAATLAAFTVETIVASVAYAAEVPERWVVCGGGRHNQAILEGLRARLDGVVSTAEEVGFQGDDVEAEAWAYLGVRSARGLTITVPGTTGVPVEQTGGVLARAAAR